MAGLQRGHQSVFPHAEGAHLSSCKNAKFTRRLFRIKRVSKGVRDLNWSALRYCASDECAATKWNRVDFSVILITLWEPKAGHCSPPSGRLIAAVWASHNLAADSTSVSSTD